MLSLAKRGTAILVALAGLGILTVTLVGWNWLRGPIGWFASQQLGRPVAIRGDLHVRLLSRSPRITADRIVLANAPWGSAPEMLEIGRLSATLDASQLLHGRVVLPELVVSHPSVLLERNETGEGNWPGAPTGGPGRAHPPTLKWVRLEGGVVRYRDQATRTQIDLEMSTPKLAPPEEQVVEVRARGEVFGRAFSVERIEATIGPEMSLVASGLLVANAPWGTRPIMAAIRQASVRLDLARLLGGQVVVRDLQLSEPNVLLETSRGGNRNWSVAPRLAPRGPPRRPHHLRHLAAAEPDRPTPP